MAGSGGKTMEKERGKENERTPRECDLEADRPDPDHEPNLDSGYAWVLLAVMFLLSSSTAGTSRVYGLVYARQISIGYYDHEEASWPIATASTVENLLGVLTPALAQVLSWRQIQLLSTGLFLISNLGAYFSDSLLIDILCLGVIQGIALSSNTVLQLAIINDYFERLRTTAFGVAMSGATCGVLFLCPAVNLILNADPQAFRPVYLFIALVLTLNIVLSLFIKPRSETSSYKKWLREMKEREEKESKGQRTESLELEPEPEPAIERNRLSVYRRTSRIESHLERKSSIASISLSIRSRQGSIYGSTRNQRPADGKRHSRGSGSGSGTNTTTENPPENRARANCKLRNEKPAQEQSERGAHPPEHAAKLEPELKFSGANRRLSVCLPEPAEPEQNDVGQVRGLVDSLKLLGSPYLHCVWIMLSIYYFVSRIFIIILADFGTDHGLSPGDAYQLLNFWSLGELLGRVVLAVLIDLRWISVKSCIVLTCSLMAASIAAMVAIEGFVVYALCSTVTAALASLEYMLINTLMVEYLGKSRALGCYAVAALICSLTLFGRPSLIGLFRDQMGSYDGLLLLLAAGSLAFGLLFGLLEPLFVRRWPKQA